MTHARFVRSTIALVGTACLAPACILAPMSTGEIDQDTTDGATGDVEATDTDNVGTTSTTPGADDGSDGSMADETGDAPEAMQWTEIVGTPSNDADVCAVAIDPTGRIAVSWFVDAGPIVPVTRTGIRIYGPDGSEGETIEATSEVFGPIAFASDGTLRVRGATELEGDYTVDWVRAYDASLDEAWSASYSEKVGWHGCGRGWRGVAVDPSDHVVTYDYTCGPGVSCPQSVIRRHAPDGTLLWERNPSGNPGLGSAPLAVGADGSIFDGAVVSWDDYDDLEIRKHDADGTELWMTTILGDVYGLWAAGDGGAWVLTSSADGLQTHRLGGGGEVLSTTLEASPAARVIGPTSDDSGFFAVGDGDLQRRTTDMQMVWSIPLPHTELIVAAVTDDHHFAFVGRHAGGGNNYWVTSVTLP